MESALKVTEVSTCKNKYTVFYKSTPKGIFWPPLYGQTKHNVLVLKITEIMTYVLCSGPMYIKYLTKHFFLPNMPITTPVRSVGVRKKEYDIPVLSSIVP